MSEEVQQSNALVAQEQPPSGMFNRSLPAAAPGTNVGAVAIEQERAIAEAQGQLILAKKFPRNLAAAHAELMESCSIRSFAEVAFYTVPNRGSGPSIRFAEEVARVYGNFQYGHRELSRGDGKSEVEVYAWDMQNNNYSKRQITVLHVVDTKHGPKVLRDQADIDNRIANVASKQIRGRILALMPKWLISDAIEKCKATLAGTSEEPVAVRIRKMSSAFAKYGVTVDHIEQYLGHPLDNTTVDEIVDLIGIFNAIKDGSAKPSEYFNFGNKEAEEEASASTASKLQSAAKAGNAAAAANSGAKQQQQARAAAQKQEQQVAASQPASSQPQQDSKPEKKDGNSVKAEDAPSGESNAAGSPSGEKEQQTPPPATSDTDDGADLF